jgi:hypothetical protein
MSILKDRYRTQKSKFLACSAAALIALSSAAVMQGCGGDTDCSKPADAQARVDGKSAGYNAAKASLTYDQGKKDGRQGGYNRGYNLGYHDANGYDNGFAIGKSEGIQAGRGDLYTISAAAEDGANDGARDGAARGQHDGYMDGYIKAHDAAFAVGQFSCGGYGNAADDKNACTNLGYSEGFAQYRAEAGTPYAQGLKDGDTEGYTAGIQPGENQGKADGRAAGYIVGQQQGKDQAYIKAYNSAYADGKLDQTTGVVSGGKIRAYNDNYFTAYGSGQRPTARTGSVSNGTGGEGDGFHDGYVDGHKSSCPNVPLPASATTQSYSFYCYGSSDRAAAQELLFFGEIQNNMVTDVYVDSYSKYMNQQEADQLNTRIYNERVTNQLSIQ